MKKSFLYKNSLTIVFFLIFVISLAGQIFTGFKQYNEELKDDKYQQVTMGEYLKSGHFISATFENWESEFLQMALFVVFSRFLRQEGSSESKKIEDEEEVDKEPDPNKKDAPWPVQKGGLILSLYKNSLSIVLLLLYLVSFCLHTVGSRMEFNAKQMRSGKPTETIIQFLTSSKLWFESFQNWQSEFLSIFAIILLSVYFRQKGSAQSKPVDASLKETGS